MNVLEQGAHHLMARMQQYAGVDVTYIRAGQQSVTFTAVPGRVPASLYDAQGASLRVVVNDFIIDRGELAGFVPPTPMRGDKIIRGDETFIVSGEDLGTTHYEDGDS
ncbi:unnamed protein product, partial [marine sediment metagenome]